MTENYSKAFDLLRTHRIDLNLLFDINVDGFVAKTDEIVK